MDTLTILRTPVGRVAEGIGAVLVSVLVVVGLVAGLTARAASLLTGTAKHA